ncbi:MAG: hypothetical protein IRZ00_19570 [Gemmatimonadetes bacterium]|nr:hypothetical protein [Gemmatimonadota bacterium]
MERGDGGDDVAGGGETRWEGARLLRLDVACPRCGSRPALRVAAELARLAGAFPPARRLGSYQCQRRGCGAIYDLPARAYQRAG